MKSERTIKGGVGLLAVLAAAAAVSAILGWSSAAAPARSGTPPPPTERIDVEQAVDFPYDI
jgi:hypothetical protein